jgi:hypothetical protein
MALILPGGGVADIRGSVAGSTFARNHYGNYVRSRTKPVNPNTDAQIRQRDILSDLATYWRDTLTDSERTAWNAYAASTAWLNALGQTVHLTGQAHFVRSNSIRLLCAQSILATAPTTPGIPAAPTLWTPSGTVSSGKVSIAWTFSPVSQGYLYPFLVSRPVSRGRAFFKGPWRYLGTVIGAATPPTSPLQVDYPWTLGTDSQVFVAARLMLPDGRLSTPLTKSFQPTAGGG